MEKLIRSKKSLYLGLAILSLIFFGVNAGTFGHVLGGDSEAYYTQFHHHIGVSPLYPLFIYLLKLMVGEGLYLDAAAVVQILFLVFAIIYVVAVMSEQFSLSAWESAVVWFFAMIPFGILLPEDPIGHTIMTESITFPLTYLFTAVMCRAVLKKENKFFAQALGLAMVSALVRSQMLFLFAVIGLAYFYVEWKVLGVGKRFFCRLLCCFAVIILAMKSTSWMTDIYERVFFGAENVAYSDQTMVQHMLYLSDAEDEQLFEDEDIREIFRRCYAEMEVRQTVHAYQPTGLTAWREIVRDCGENSYLLTEVIDEYMGEKGLLAEGYLEKEKQVAEISHELAYPLLKVHWMDKLREAFTLMPSGFVSTVLFHKESLYGLIHLLTGIFYVFAIVAGIICYRRDRKNQKAAEYMCLVLTMSVVNVVSCNLIHFGLQRYLAYTLGLNWVGMFLLMRKLFSGRLADLRSRSEQMREEKACVGENKGFCEK